MAIVGHGRRKIEYETAATAISYSTAGEISNCNYKLIEVRLHLSAAGGTSENLTIVINSSLGATFDTKLISQDMLLVTDYVYKPEGDGDHILYKGSTIDIKYTNTNSRNYGLEVIYEVI